MTTSFLKPQVFWPKHLIDTRTTPLVITYQDNILPAHWKLLLRPGVKTYYEDNNKLFVFIMSQLDEWIRGGKNVWKVLNSQAQNCSMTSRNLELFLFRRLQLWYSDCWNYFSILNCWSFHEKLLDMDVDCSSVTSTHTDSDTGYHTCFFFTMNSIADYPKYSIGKTAWDINSEWLLWHNYRVFIK